YPEIHPPSQEISDEVFQANHSVQYKENLENSLNSNQEKEGPPQDFDIRQLIREECCIEVCEEQKQKIEDTILDALNSKLLSINYQRLEKEKQEVKNVVEQPAEQPEHSFSMGYEHFNTTLVTDLDQVAELVLRTSYQSHMSARLLNEIESDKPVKDDSLVFTNFSNPLFKDNDDLTSSDGKSLSEEDVPIEESKVYSNPLFDDNEINSDELESHVESNFVESQSNHDALIDSSQKIDYLEEFFGELAHINPEITEADLDFEKEICSIENLLYDKSSPRPPKELNAEIANIIVESIPSSPIPVQDGDSQREEIDIITNTDDVLPPSVENDDDSEGEINAVEELLSDNSIPLTEDESSDSDHQDDPSIPLPPPEPSDAKIDFELDAEISVVKNTIVEFECLRDEFDDDYYFSFMFVIYSKVFSFLLSAESEDTIFDLGISV
nr:hypothetical protein [Tanacetum cinerariifolium]